MRTHTYVEHALREKGRVPWPGRCAECERPLNDYAIRHGWVTVQVGFDQARVHTVCRAQFAARKLDDQKARIARNEPS